MREAEIIISGQPLTFGESMTVRVAIQHYAAFLHENGLGKDKLGRDICEGYLKNIIHINHLIALTAR